MARQPYKTTKNYARRLHELSKRIINQRYEGHNVMTKVDYLIKQIEDKLSYVDQRAAMVANRAKKRKAEERKIKVAEALEEEDVVVIEAEAGRIESAERNGPKGAVATLS